MSGFYTISFAHVGLVGNVNKHNFYSLWKLIKLAMFLFCLYTSIITMMEMQAWVACKINENNWCFQNFHTVTYEYWEYVKKTMPALFVNGNPRILSFPSLMAALPIMSRLHFLYSEGLSQMRAITLINVIRKHPILWSNLLLVCWLLVSLKDTANSVLLLCAL